MDRKIILNVDKLLEDRNMTIQDLHTATGIRYNTLRQYVKNVTVRPDLEILAQLATYFELDNPGDLFRFEE